MSEKKTIGITGVSGSLGQALTKKYKSLGHKIIGFTHKKDLQDLEVYLPDELVYWECNKEYLLEEKLKEIDILILNHGIYESKKNNALEDTIQINALSTLRIYNLFEKIALLSKDFINLKEIWINTSEAEILPALNPSYEVSKNLIGQMISIKKNFLTKENSRKFKVRKIIIGPFKSELNPIGIMSPEFVASLIIFFSKINSYLIIVSPNPITFIVFPLKELYFRIYYSILKCIKNKD